MEFFEVKERGCCWFCKVFLCWRYLFLDDGVGLGEEWWVGGFVGFFEGVDYLLVDFVGILGDLVGGFGIVGEWQQGGLFVFFVGIVGEVEGEVECQGGEVQQG